MDPPADIQSNGLPDATLPTPLPIPNEIEHEATNGTELVKAQPPSLSEYPSPSLRSHGWEATTGTGDSIFDYIFSTPAVEKLPYDRDPHDKKVFPDSGGIPRLRPVMPVAHHGSPTPPPLPTRTSEPYQPHKQPTKKGKS